MGENRSKGKENFQTVSLVFRQVFEQRVQRKFENLHLFDSKGLLGIITSGVKSQGIDRGSMLICFWKGPLFIKVNT